LSISSPRPLPFTEAPLAGIGEPSFLEPHFCGEASSSWPPPPSEPLAIPGAPGQTQPPLPLCPSPPGEGSNPADASTGPSLVNKLVAPVVLFRFLRSLSVPLTRVSPPDPLSVFDPARSGLAFLPAFVNRFFCPNSALGDFFRHSPEQRHPWGPSVPFPSLAREKIAIPRVPPPTVTLISMDASFDASRSPVRPRRILIRSPVRLERGEMSPPFRPCFFFVEPPPSVLVSAL